MEEEEEEFDSDEDSEDEDSEDLSSEGSEGSEPLMSHSNPKLSYSPDGQVRMSPFYLRPIRLAKRPSKAVPLTYDTRMTLTYMPERRFKPTHGYQCQICDRRIKGWHFTMIDHLKKFHFEGGDISKEDRDYYFRNVKNMIIRRSKFN